MRNDILEAIKKTLLAISQILPQLFPRPAYDEPPQNLPMNQDPEPAKTDVPKQQLLSMMLMAISRHEGWTVGEIRHDQQ